MSRPRIADHRITLRLPADLRTPLAAAAKELGLDLASFIRLVLAQRILGPAATEEECRAAFGPGIFSGGQRAGVEGLARAVARASQGRMSQAEALAALRGAK